MTSLIFGSIYMGHKAFTNHHREKQRVKNYERWEGLRDEYDEQRKISRESRSLDIQRTGAWDQESGYQVTPPLQQQPNDYHNDRPILTLRDQQEAGDARTSWRTQESWDGSQGYLKNQQTGFNGYPQAYSGMNQRHVSMPAASMNPSQTGATALPAQPTGGTWDTPLPAPLRVSRQSFDDYDHQGALLGRGRNGSVPARQSSLHGMESVPESRSPSHSRQSSRHSPVGRNSLDAGSNDDRRMSGLVHGSSGLRDSSTPDFDNITDTSSHIQENNPNNPFTSAYYERRNKAPAYGVSDFDSSGSTMQSTIPGGRMAELLEAMPVQQQQQYFQGPAGGRMAELIERGY